MSFSKAFVIVDFYANRSEIELKYCVNKNRPLLHCNGHCFLMKALKKEQQQEKDLGDSFSKVNSLICQHYFSSVQNISPKYTIKSERLFLHDSPIWQLYVVDPLLKPPAQVLA
ncbi:hypothetical protein [Rhizosphaericola mali]|uniref:Uncharacterized protein n=1 Tax=Rhizosphaericola mali TaxID=2545455 RepID=A0A5P2G289_9BACT|nr:hypothetical protein [Rhizosphaericola mali]QES89585.1 hypothetical protein E0W69_013245 [Rhizosphaericola mali]